MPPKNYRKITNTKHLRQVLSLAINRVLNDEMDSQIANSIASLANAMLKVLRVTNLEDRIDELERGLKNEQDKEKNPVTSDIERQIRALYKEASDKE